MKKLLGSILVLLVITFSSCIMSKNITERYVKTSIENHDQEFSSIRTFPVFAGKTTSTQGSGLYLEITGYKYKEKKSLIIGAIRSNEGITSAPKVIANYNITYTELTLDQCKAIVDNYKELKKKFKAEKRQGAEKVYHDFNLSKDVFISLCKSGSKSSTTYVDFWIKGEKYKVSSIIVIKKLEKFIEW